VSNHQAIQWALKQQPSTSTEKFVLVILASHCNSKSADASLCFPGQETIADIGRCSIDTVQRALKRLARDGFIEIEKGAEGNGQRRYDRYRLKLDSASKSIIKRSATSPAGSEAAICGPAQAAECGATDAANCGSSQAANQAANHAANHAANCGPNLKEPREPLELKGARAGACEASASPARAESWREWKPGQSVILRRSDWPWSRWMTFLPVDQADACSEAKAIEVSKLLPGPGARLLRVFGAPQASEEPSVIRMNGHGHG
jgi:DNA-binding MarR family transcriptional regulator